jgi:serine/threonine-protein kinase
MMSIVAFYCPRCGHCGEAGACPRDGVTLAPVGSHDLLGHQVGDYVVLASLGGGSFGRVYRAIHARSGAVVAIKLMQQPVGDAANDAQRVIREARAAAMIRHANVVAVYDLGVTSDRRPYIVMQHLDGTTLRLRLAPRAAITELAPLAADILRGLAAAHDRGVVHRDLKPDNVFVVDQPRTRAVIVDFGLAKLVADPRAPHLTITGESIGTPRYMAPEQIRGKPVDGRADLYAVGVMLYEALAGEPPFIGESTFQLFDMHVNQPAPSLAAARPDLSVAVCEVIDRALAKNPADRFPDANAMRRALAAAVATKQRRRWPFVAAGTGATAFAAVAIAMALTRGSAAPAEPPAERPLPDQYQRGLDVVAANLAHYTHTDVLRLICPIDRLFRTNAKLPDDTYRTYLHRLHDLLSARAGDDLAAECIPYEQ